MWIFYIIAVLPIIAGLLLYMFNKEVAWKEWIICSVITLTAASITHVITFQVMTHDTETWSGFVTEAVYEPRWIEEYQEMHTRTVGSGDDQHTETYYTTEHRNHGPDWWVLTTLGKQTISQDKFNEIKHNFGGTIRAIPGSRSGFDGGDRNDYHTINTTKYIEPVNDSRSFRNMFKASQNIMTFVKVPKNTPVFAYPKSPSFFTSGRLLGTATNKINIKAWDQINARLGSAKKVNIIMIGFVRHEASFGQYQEAFWLGGKKNDLVICYGPGWAYVFGWTEKTIVKRNIETIMLNTKETNVFPQIEAEVLKNYQIKDWKKFDYLTLYPPTWVIILFSILLLAFEVGYWYWAITNDTYKENKRSWR